VKTYDIIEAIEENFVRGLKDINVNEKDPCCKIKVQEVDQKTFEYKNGEKIKRYGLKLFVKNMENALAVIEDWETPSNFDYLAFKNVERDKLEIGVHEVTQNLGNPT